MATVTQGAKVGAFLLISAAGGFLVYNTVKKEVGRGTGYTVHAYLNDASGLAPHSRVTIAGIPVGQIQKIYLEGGRARVDVDVGSDVELNATATLGVRSASLLGENVIVLQPGVGGPKKKDGSLMYNIPLIDGKTSMIYSPMEYGSGSHAEWQAWVFLQENGFIQDTGRYENGVKKGSPSDSPVTFFDYGYILTKYL